jgi:GMP synthase (glutamine-hydrolysing)
MHIHFVQHVAFENPGSIIPWAVKNNHSISFTNTFEQAVFPAPGQFDMLVIMGGPMGVYEEDKFSWMTTEKKFIRTAIDAEKKILGICLGCQLIANVLGAAVYRHAHPEIGWWPVQKSNAHPLTTGLSGTFTAFHLHGDSFDLPPGALQLFRSIGCEQQGFLFNNNIAGLQFHPEIEQQLFLDMLDNEKESLQPGTWVQAEKELRAQALLQLPYQQHWCHSFLENFVKMP